jgi:predicted nucleic acid-binding protein
VNVLVDTSVWSLALRRSARQLNPAEKSQVAELAELINEGRAKLLGIVRQELLSGIKLQSQFSKLQEILRSFPDEPVSTTDHESAADFGNQCRSKGVAVSTVDMLICSVAHSRGWALFSTDPDFKRYATVLPISLHTLRN